jgi:hypothetical protein
MRKTVRAIAYTREISTASFLGRPPRISYRHWNLGPPLDLTESELFSKTPEELSRLVADLDEYGLRRNRELTHTTFLITWIAMSKNREDILELALGEYSHEEMLRRADDIECRMDQHYARVPEFILNLDNDESYIDPTKPVHTILRISYFHGMQSNKLLLQRVLVRKAGVGSSGLIQVAQTILMSVIKISERADMFPEYSAYLFPLGVSWIAECRHGGGRVTQAGATSRVPRGATAPSKSDDSRSFRLHIKTQQN